MSVLLELDEGQELLVATTQRFIEAELPIAATRALHADPHGFDRGWWQKGADLGWFAMLVPEADGGGDTDGSGIADACLIAELHGGNVQPGPFVGTNLAAWAVATFGSPDLLAAVLPSLVDGALVATWAPGRPQVGASTASVVIGAGGRVSGRAELVQDAVAADLLLVAVDRDTHALIRTDAPGVEVVALSGLDLSRRLAQVTFDGVAVADHDLLSGDGMDAGLIRRALALNAADTVGAMDALFGLTVAYAKDRTAFGRPIGSFQAIKHILADQALYLETARAGTAALISNLATQEEQAGELAHVVAAYVGEHGNELAQECLQVLGGIGFTWEHDLHLWMRRVRTNSSLYGEATWHREAICRVHGLVQAEP